MKFNKTYRQFWQHHKLLMLSLHFMFFSLVFTDLIIGNQPLVCKYKGEWTLLIFQSQADEGSELLKNLREEASLDYRKLRYDFVIWPLIPMDAKTLEAQSAWQKPFTKNQQGNYFILGSYDLGRDVLAGCIYGLQKSLWLALLSIFISGILGILIGSVFSFQSQRFEKISILSSASLIVFLFLFLYTIVLFITWNEILVFPLIILLLLQSICLFLTIYFFDASPGMSFRMDFIGLRYIELMKSIPVILILLILLQVVENPGIWTLACLISLVYTPIIAKYARAFTMSASNESFIHSIQSLGQTGIRTYVKHIFPQVMSQLFPILAFGVANVILVEASLSFLGLGFSMEEVSLGTMMFSAREYPTAWWVIIFPGLLVFWLVLSFNTWGEHWSNQKWIRDFQT